METALCIAYINTFVNGILAVLKLTVGFASGSEALVSDGVHSVTDVFSSIVVVIGIKLSLRLSDRHHPYGHERMECVAAVMLSVLVGITGVWIGITGVVSVLRGSSAGTSPPGVWALAVTVLSVVVKEMMFRYTRRAALRVRSGALMADAWHLRADALTSLGGFIGVLGANLGLAVLDPIAAVLISVCIVKAAVSIFADAMRKMTDCSCDEQTEEAIKCCISENTTVYGIRGFKTRLFGSRILVEVTVEVADSLSCKQAFEVAASVKRTVCERFETVKECAVHIYPLENDIQELQSSL